MKKHTIKLIFMMSIFLLPISLTSQSQNLSYTRKVELHDNRGEVYPLMAKGFMVSLATYYPVYETLFQKTGISQSYCRVIASGVSIFSGYVLNRMSGEGGRELGFELWGAGMGAFACTITIGFDTKRDRQRKILKHETL